MIVTLVPSWLRPPRTKDVFDHLARFDALDCLLLGRFVSVRNRWPKNIFDHAPRKAFYEEFNGFWIPKVITSNSGEAFEVVSVLVDFGPLQAKGF